MCVCVSLWNIRTRHYLHLHRHNLLVPPCYTLRHRHHRTHASGTSSRMTSTLRVIPSFFLCCFFELLVSLCSKIFLWNNKNMQFLSCYRSCFTQLQQCYFLFSIFFCLTHLLFWSGQFSKENCCSLFFAGTPVSAFCYSTNSAKALEWPVAEIFILFITNWLTWNPLKILVCLCLWAYVCLCPYVCLSACLSLSVCSLAVCL